MPNTVQGKHLVDGSEFAITFPSNIHVETSFRELEDVVLNSDQAKYAFRSSKMRGAYDSFLWDGFSTCYIFQITLAEKRGILNHPLRKFLDWIKKFNIINLDIKFVFVVPSANIEKWVEPQKLVGDAYERKEHMVSIEQYVVSLDT